MSIIEAIDAKRDGRENSEAELRSLASGAADGSIPDYQLAAWLMAAYLNGLSPRETADLTLAMAASGERLDLTGLPKPWVDKHSTGGVGDKTTLVVLPILAACGLTMVKMSGRGLGITGGTIDKLDSVEGFRTDLSPEEMKGQAARIGLALTGQTPRLAPADKALYALRDVTGTVASVPLITASILSKKIAGGAETVVLDVKCGSGAFMRTLNEAQALAASLVSVGELAGLAVRSVVTDMDQPLGRCVGNALEVREAWETLAPGGEYGPATARFRELCLQLAGIALEAVGKGGLAEAVDALESGAAFAKATEWFVDQGADPAAILAAGWQQAPARADVKANRPGWIARVDARQIGEAAVSLGAGRRTKADEIDPRVGIECLAPVGSGVAAGQAVLRVHARDDQSAQRAALDLTRAVEVVDGEVFASPVLLA
jgi:pyrimidine-nucleoside phosphorylase